MEEKQKTRAWKTGFLTKENFRDLVICLLLIVISVKIIQIDLRIDFAGFNFTDLLSMLLAFFATALSAAFYFKANESSNVFYNNTYKFTKDVSEILGRIEAGFGERLKHIDESYVGLSNKIDRFDVGKAKEEQRKEEELIREKEEERERLFNDLTERAKSVDAEMAALLSKLKENALELEKSHDDLNRLKSQIHDSRVNTESGGSLVVQRSFIEYLADRLKANFGESLKAATMRDLEQCISVMFKTGSLDERDRNYMLEKSLINDDNSLTRKGRTMLRNLVLSYLD